MPSKSPRPYGSWPSSLSAARLAEAGIRFGHLAVDELSLYWLESRPSEGGRVVLMAFDEARGMRELTSRDFSVRSRVNEYGGGDFWVKRGQLVFVNDADQRLYYLREGQIPRPLTAPAPTCRAWRYADGAFNSDGTRFVCVRERHQPDGAVLHDLIGVDVASGELAVLASGRDFYAFPRLADDGRLAFVAWDHPTMPWQSSELWLGRWGHMAAATDLSLIAGGAGSAVAYPQFCPAGRLHFIGDACGYDSLYVLHDDGVLQNLTPVPVDFSPSYWGLGYSSYGFCDDGQILLQGLCEGEGQCFVLEPQTDQLHRLDLPVTTVSGHCAVAGQTLWLTGSGPRQAEALLAVELGSQQCRIIRQAGQMEGGLDCVANPEKICFPSGNGRQAHGFYYAPCHSQFEGPADERPPLIVMSHGGPTGAASSGYSPAIQFWTQRGFAVVDVNYLGSTGFGRAYREALNGQWGIADAEDCVYAARYLAGLGRVDGKRLVIRGGSAGGFTTLCALVRYPDFAAGMSRYGVASLEALARDTHKFEAHYLDSLVAPYPANAALYRERSPLTHAAALSCPLLILQGEDDTVVPPAQAEALVRALEAKGLPYEYRLFTGEGHGFRKAETIEEALERELAFYGKVLGFTPAEPGLGVRGC